MLSLSRTSPSLCRISQDEYVLSLVLRQHCTFLLVLKLLQCRTDRFRKSGLYPVVVKRKQRRPSSWVKCRLTCHSLLQLPLHPAGKITSHHGATGYADLSRV